MNSEITIHNEAITGGPCGGKSSSIPWLRQQLEDKGCMVFTIPEWATFFDQNGITMKDGRFTSPQFQEALIEQSIFTENLFRKKALQAKGPAKRIILHDRGIMDMQAYMSYAQFNKLLKAHNLGRNLRDERYHGVFFMQSTAVDAPEFYTCANNTSRKESNPKDAIEADRKTRKVWQGHPHFRLLDNSGGFEHKCNKLLQEICHHIGHPVPIEIENKYWLKPLAISKLPDHDMVEIEQIYLITPDPKMELRIRRRGIKGAYTYYMTEKRDHPRVGRIEKESFISKREYELLQKQQDKTRRVIKKKRHCFISEGQYFELDVYHGHLEGLFILEIELTEENKVVTLPEYIRRKLRADVTDNPYFKNSNLAKISSINNLPRF